MKFVIVESRSLSREGPHVIYKPPKPAVLNLALIALWLAHTNKRVLR